MITLRINYRIQTTNRHSKRIKTKFYYTNNIANLKKTTLASAKPYINSINGYKLKENRIDALIKHLEQNMLFLLSFNLL
jgi:hypothetical protein